MMLRHLIMRVEAVPDLHRDKDTRIWQVGGDYLLSQGEEGGRDRG
jgi:hypothetical protein